LLFIDYDDVDEATLREYAELNQQLILITKSYYMKQIDTLELNLHKVMYEPINSTKVKAVLDSYDPSSVTVKDKKSKRKKFNEKTSKFSAKVLVAEDNIINQKLIKRTLEDLGLEITLASNGLEAFEKRKNNDFDVIFMDIQMPVLDGMEATQEILDYEEDFNQPHIPIIALTANALKGDRERFMEVGMDEYTTKPLVRTEIITLLNRFIAHKIIDVVPTTASQVITSQEVPVEKVTVTEPIVEEVAQPEIVEVAQPESEEIALQPMDEMLPAPVEPEPEPEPVEDVKPAVLTADILLYKHNTLEQKLFSHLLDELHYSHEHVSNDQELRDRLYNNNYKIVLFDKESLGMSLKELHDIISGTSMKPALVMLIDTATDEVQDDRSYANEIIKNVMNKDLLRLMIEKFI